MFNASIGIAFSDTELQEVISITTEQKNKYLIIKWLLFNTLILYSVIMSFYGKCTMFKNDFNELNYLL